MAIFQVRRLLTIKQSPKTTCVMRARSYCRSIIMCSDSVQPYMIQKGTARIRTGMPVCGNVEYIFFSYTFISFGKKKNTGFDLELQRAEPSMSISSTAKRKEKWYSRMASLRNKRKFLIWHWKIPLLTI